MTAAIDKGVSTFTLNNGSHIYLYSLFHIVRDGTIFYACEQFDNNYVISLVPEIGLQ